MLRLLIRGSLTAQERIRVAAGGRGSGRTALVIGGAGKMGRWFCGVPGFAGICRRRSPIRPARRPASRTWPTGATARWNTTSSWSRRRCRSPTDPAESCAARRPRGTIFDIGSLKTPLRAGLDALRSLGCNVTSLHPMFGPDTELLSGRHVIFIDVGVRRRVAAGARAVRFDDGRAGRDVARRARSPHRLCAGPVARAEHRLLHRARR